ncbi:MAG: chromate resistance protein [Candidatus Tectomicrobia bacterium]|nr:chromate resistance protein [Candidatus Tectomicrobia bacterium]
MVFSYSLPSKGHSSPRVALWRRLRRLGAISPTKGVYVLPARDECVEAFQWLAQEVQQAKGEALMMRVEQFEGLPDSQLIKLFRDVRTEEYAEVDAQAIELEKSIISSGMKPEDHSPIQDALDKLLRRHAEIARVDFFDASEGAHVASRLARIEQALSSEEMPTVDVPPADIAAYRSKRWVTRPRPHVDRLACIWLIRRFLNPTAVIRYSLEPEPDEVAFDMSEREFGHQGNLCTFETMVTAFRLDEPGLRAISEIVHEIDLRDGRYMRPEIAGVDAVLKGWLLAGLSDAELEAHGVALFEGLYATLHTLSG